MKATVLEYFQQNDRLHTGKSMRTHRCLLILSLCSEDGNMENRGRKNMEIRTEFQNKESEKKLK